MIEFLMHSFYVFFLFFNQFLSCHILIFQPFFFHLTFYNSFSQLLAFIDVSQLVPYLKRWSKILIKTLTFCHFAFPFLTTWLIIHFVFKQLVFIGVHSICLGATMLLIDNDNESIDNQLIFSQCIFMPNDLMELYIDRFIDNHFSHSTMLLIDKVNIDNQLVFHNAY